MLKKKKKRIRVQKYTYVCLNSKLEAEIWNKRGVDFINSIKKQKGYQRKEFQYFKFLNDDK